MNLDNNTLIKCRLNDGFEFIKGLEKYDLVLIDNSEILLNNKKQIKGLLSDCSGLLIYIDEFIDCNKLSFFNMTLINIKKINNKYLYFYGHKNICFNYNKDINKLMENKIEAQIVKIDKDDINSKNITLNLFNKDNVLNYNLNRCLNKAYLNTSKIKVLDLTINEELVQSLILNDFCKITILGQDKIKTRTILALNNKKMNCIELIN